MAFSYLNEENIYRKYTASKRYTDSLTEPFPEFARIARNRASKSDDPNYPNVTDGTTASIIRKTPRRVVQQLPTGKAENDQDDWLSVIADFVLVKKILPFANEEYELIDKCWNVIEAGLTFGACATYTPFVNHDGYMCSDLSLLYWGDISLQPGKKSGYANKYVFVQSWWQPEDIEALIDREKKLKKEAKQRGEEYESTWDIQALEEIKDSGSVKDRQSKTPTEEERSVDTNGIQLITGFQEGVQGKFYTFHGSEKRIVRRETNRDPRGKMPIDWFYSDTDGSNPWGRGIIELVGGLQNLIDSDMRMYQYNRALMLAPPLVKYGNVSNVKMAPHAVMTAKDPNAKIDTIKIDTTAVANYPALYGLQKSQLLNLVSSPDTSISADVGNPGFSKTPAGINQQQATISVDDNYLRKKFEGWFENWCETAINLYFAKRSGVELLQLDDEYADRLRELANDGKFDLNNLSDDNQVMINYDDATPALKFRVDAASSKKNEDQEQVQALTGLLETLNGNPVLQQAVPQDKVWGVWNSIVSNSAVEKPQTLLINIEEMKAQQQAMAEAQAQAAAQSKMQPQAPAPDPADEQIAQQLTALGVPDQSIGWALDQLNQGAHEDDVLAELGVA